MTRYEEHMAKKALEPQMIDDLREQALEDAKETFREEQLEHWYHDVKDPPEPRHSWLTGWMAWLDREPSDSEWIVYRAAYKNYMRKAIRKLDAMFDQYARSADDAVDDALHDVTEACLDAMEE